MPPWLIAFLESNISLSVNLTLWAAGSTRAAPFYFNHLIKLVLFSGLKLLTT